MPRPKYFPKKKYTDTESVSSKRDGGSQQGQQGQDIQQPTGPRPESATARHSGSSERRRSSSASESSRRKGKMASKDGKNLIRSKSVSYNVNREFDLGNATKTTDFEFVEKFNENEMKRLKKRFKKLDLDNSGTLSNEEIIKIPQIAKNPLIHRVLAMFDTNNDGEVDFTEFIQGLSIFCVETSLREKLLFLFKIYDINGDGFITSKELFQVMKILVGNNLEDQKLQEVVNKTIVYVDKNGDGKISFQEFCMHLEPTQANILASKLTISDI